tara:strand:- start:454 stop:666 length:213 start_codon:yes stop_codon:yes gene_type:complete
MSKVNKDKVKEILKSQIPCKNFQGILINCSGHSEVTWWKTNETSFEKINLDLTTNEPLAFLCQDGEFSFI